VASGVERLQGDDLDGGPRHGGLHGQAAGSRGGRGVELRGGHVAHVVHQGPAKESWSLSSKTRLQRSTTRTSLVWKMWRSDTARAGGGQPRQPRWTAWSSCRSCCSPEPCEAKLEVEFECKARGEHNMHVACRCGGVALQGEGGGQPRGRNAWCSCRSCHSPGLFKGKLEVEFECKAPGGSQYAHPFPRKCGSVTLQVEGGGQLWQALGRIAWKSCRSCCSLEPFKGELEEQLEYKAVGVAQYARCFSSKIWRSDFASGRRRAAVAAAGWNCVELMSLTSFTRAHN